MAKPWKDRTDEELADEAQVGFRGQGAIVEIARRLREELVRQQRATNWLTIALVFFAVVQTTIFIAQVLRRQ